MRTLVAYHREVDLEPWILAALVVVLLLGAVLWRVLREPSPRERANPFGAAALVLAVIAWLLVAVPFVLLVFARGQKRLAVAGFVAGSSGPAVAAAILAARATSDACLH